MLDCDALLEGESVVLLERRRWNGLSVWNDAIELKRRRDEPRESGVFVLSLDWLLRDSMMMDCFQVDRTGKESKIVCPNIWVRKRTMQEEESA
jgi:hypothetical protein